MPQLGFANELHTQGGAQKRTGGKTMFKILSRLWSDEQGQDVAEYALMLAVICVVVIATLVLIGQNANNIFSTVASVLGSVAGSGA